MLWQHGGHQHGPFPRKRANMLIDVVGYLGQDALFLGRTGETIQEAGVVENERDVLELGHFGDVEVDNAALARLTRFLNLAQRILDQAANGRFRTGAFALYM